MKAAVFLQFALCIVCSFLMTYALERAHSSWTVEKFLSTEKYHRDDRLPHGCLLVDPDSTLTQTELLKLRKICLRASLLDSPFTPSSCSSDYRTGFQLAILILGRIANATNEGIMTFASEVSRDWNIIQSICNDGVLFLISVDDNQVAFIAGEQSNNIIFKERHEQVITEMKNKLQKGQLEKAVVIGMKALSPEERPHLLLALILILFTTVVILRTILNNPQTFQWSFRREVKVTTHQDRVNNYVDLNTDGFFPGLGNQPLLGQDTCAICLTGFTASGQLSVLRKLWNLIMYRHVHGHFSNRAATLRCGHSCCNSCLRRWLGTNRQCPLCRRTVSEVSSVGPESDVNGYSVQSSRFSSTAGRLLLAETSEVRIPQRSRREVYSLTSSRLGTRRNRSSPHRTREWSLDSFNSWTSVESSA